MTLCHLRKYTTVVFAIALVAVAIAYIATDLSQADEDQPHTITFDPNTGEAKESRIYVAENVIGSIYIPGNDFTVDGVEYEYTKDGYSFVGWSENPNSLTANIMEGSVWEVHADMTLYAIWDANTYDVTLHYGNTTTTIGVKYGTTTDTTHMMFLSPPGMSDYVIVGWTTYDMVAEGEKDLGGNAYVLRSGEDVEYYSLKIALKRPGNVDNLYPVYAYKYDVSGNVSVNLGSEATGCYYITGSATSGGGVNISGGSPTLYLDSLTLDFSARTNSNSAPVVISNGADVTIVTLSDCVIKGGSNQSVTPRPSAYVGYAGINVKSGSSLTISSASIGSLTATGGSVKAVYVNSGWGGTRYNAFAGAGIGADGRNGGDDGCGSITINGGTVTATGGSGYIPYNNPNYYTVISGPGIGGSGGTVTITTGCTVVAASGNLARYSGETYYTTTAGIARDPIYCSVENVDPDANVSRFGRNTSSTSAQTVATLSFQFTGSVVGSATSFTIDGENTVNLGGIGIDNDTTIEIDASLISDGSTVTITSAAMNYFTGTAYETDPENHIFTVRNITMSTDAYTGTVSFSVNGSLLSEPIGYYGGVYNYSESGGESSYNFYNSYSLVLAANGSNPPSTTTATVRFALVLYETYSFLGMEIKSGNNWVEFTDYTADYDSVQGAVIISANVTLGYGRDSTIANDLSFTIDKKSYEITIQNVYSGGDSFPDGIVTSDTTVPSGISWNSGNSIGTHGVYHDGTVTYVVNTNNEPRPFHLDSVIVDGRSVGYADNGDGTYSFTLYNVVSDRNIAINFTETVIVKAYVPVVRGTSTVIGTMILVDESGNALASSYGSDSDGEYYYAAIEKNKAVRFTVEIFGNDYGLAAVYAIASDMSTTRIGYQSGGDYILSAVTSDTSLVADVTNLTYWVVIRSGSTDYLFKVPADSYYAAPSLEEIESIGSLYIKRGYEFGYWDIVQIQVDADQNVTVIGVGGEESKLPGEERKIASDIMYKAVWTDTKISYSLSFDLQGGEADNPDHYFIDDGTVIQNPTRKGYVFDYWTGTGIDGTAQSIVFDADTYGDRAYVAHWTEAIFLQVELRDNNLHINPDDAVIEVRSFQFGSAYGSLPIFSNYADGSVTYIFYGWALPDGTKIDSNTRVDIYDDQYIVIIWVINHGFIINVDNTSTGGVISSVSSCAIDTEITVNLLPSQGYTAVGLLINGVPAGDFVAGSSTYTFTPVSNTTLKGVFQTIEYTVTIYTGIGPDYSDTPIVYTYTVNDNLTISSASVTSIPGYAFDGWSLHPGGEVAVTNAIIIESPTTVNYTYWEVWHIVKYHITYDPFRGDNVSEFSIGDSITLVPISVSGMYFAGWFDNEEYSGDPVESFTATSDHDLFFYARLIPKAYAPVAVDFVYDGKLKTVASENETYSVQPGGVISATDAGTYSFTLSLAPGYIWDDGTTDSKDYVWSICSRHVYVIADSSEWRFGQTIEIGGFTVIGLADSHMLSASAAPESEIADIGTYRNIIDPDSVTIIDQYDDSVKANYIIHLTDGMISVSDPMYSSVTVTVEPGDEEDSDGFGASLRDLLESDSMRNVAPFLILALFLIILYAALSWRWDRT